MRTYRQDDQVKVAVYSANIPAQEQQNDRVLALLITLSAAAVLGLRYFV